MDKCYFLYLEHKATCSLSLLLLSALVPGWLQLPKRQKTCMSCRLTTCGVATKIACYSPLKHTLTHKNKGRKHMIWMSQELFFWD